MLNHKLKESIENKFKELQMNLENNYKDLAIDAFDDEAMCHYEFANLQENSTYYYTIQSIGDS